MEAQLAQHYNLDGMGIWALGFEGRNASALAALDGFAPPLKGVVPGPTRTAPSTGPGAPTPAPFTRAPTATTAPASAHHGRGGPGSTTTTTTAPGFSYTGTFGGRSVTLVPSRLKGLAAGAPAVGTLADFQTSDPADSCLVAEAALTVRQVSTPTGAMDVVTARPPHDCTKATFTFTPPAPPSGGPGTTTTTSAGPGAG